MKKYQLLLLIFAMPFVLCAQTWLGTINSDWNTPGNWQGNAVPASNGTAVFNATSSNNCDITGTISVGGINIAATYTGTINIRPGSSIAVGSNNFVQLGGTFNCGNGAFVCSNNTTFNQDGGTFISSSNTITLGGDVDFLSGGFDANGGTILFNSMSGTTNITVDGNNNASVTINNLIINIPAPAAATNIYHLGSASTLLIQGDLTISRGCFNGTVPGHVELLGNFSIAQTGTAGNLGSNINLEFMGSTNTAITLAIGGETLYKGAITLNKTNPNNTVTLNSPLVMNNSTNSGLTFITGKLVTTQVNILRIETNFIDISGTDVTSFIASDNSFVDGPMIKVGGSGNSGFVFPIGDNDKYAPLAISGANNSIINFGGAAAHSFRAEYFHADPDLNFDIDSRDPSLTNIGRCEYWVLDRLADPGANANPFVWLSYDDVRSCGISMPADLRVAKWNGTLWNDLGNVSVTNNGINFVSTSSTISTFSPFNLASVDPITNPLPITLVDFRGYLKDGIVHLNWTTAFESNSDHFKIEGSNDGILFSSLANIPAAGNSNSMLDYNYDDHTATSGQFYYRLKMIDKDGSFVYSKVIRIEVLSNNSAIQVFPNPIKTGEKISLRIPAFKNEMANVSIADITGRRITLANMRFDGNGSITLNNHLLPGIYIIQVNAADLQYTTKLSVH